MLKRTDGLMEVEIIRQSRITRKTLVPVHRLEICPGLRFANCFGHMALNVCLVGVWVGEALLVKGAFGTVE